MTVIPMPGQEPPSDETEGQRLFRESLAEADKKYADES